MRYSRSPADGHAITLDDLADFVAEMIGYRHLAGDTVIRAAGVLEFDLRDGPRVARITADTGNATATAEQPDRQPAQ
jgi:hypothetical protein